MSAKNLTYRALCTDKGDKRKGEHLKLDFTKIPAAFQNFISFFKIERAMSIFETNTEHFIHCRNKAACLFCSSQLLNPQNNHIGNNYNRDHSDLSKSA